MSTALQTYKLLAMDMDSTLITIECIDEIADYVGKKDEVAAITASAMRGEIDWPTSLRQRVAILKGLDAANLEAVYQERLQLSPGAEILLATAKRDGLTTLLVSGGFTFFTDRLRARLGLDHAYANTLEIIDGKLTGEVLDPLCDAEAKARHVRNVASSIGALPDHIIAVGDGANDLLMMREAGVSIAFYAKPVVQAAATYAINQGGLEQVVLLAGKH
jgi:phosphoserine phosphatase